MHLHHCHSDHRFQRLTLAPRCLRIEECLVTIAWLACYEISQKETELTSSFLPFIALSLLSDCIFSNFLRYILLYSYWRCTSNAWTFLLVVDTTNYKDGRWRLERSFRMACGPFIVCWLSGQLLGITWAWLFVFCLGWKQEAISLIILRYVDVAYPICIIFIVFSFNGRGILILNCDEASS